ncbi:MAG TPA: methyl-accepting chemotaxis protein, partial [Gammaproteobacteria bacterium]
MNYSGLWPKLVPVLGLALAAALLVAAVAVWWNGDAGGSEGGLGKLVAITQSARTDARDAISGDASAFDSLNTSRAAMQRLRSAVASDETAGDAARRLAGDTTLWQRLDSSIAALLDLRGKFDELEAAREEVADLAPELLVSVGNVASVLTPADLATNQPYIARFELTVESLQQNVRSLGPGVAVDEVVSRIGDAEQYLSQFVRGLRGEDATLGVVPVRSASADSDLTAIDGLLERARKGIAAVGVGAETLAAAEGAAAELDAAASELLARYVDVGPSGVSGGGMGWLPLLLVVAALMIAALMAFVYYRTRDLGRAAESQAEQNERNQQAILRLLDELSSLADGDLTVQATVTEDITGAIADSINYAIEALRELVTTINDSSILVDAASKQTEGTSRHLLRSAETQAKQAAAASESMARMAISIEEVAGNAERCSDVARHSVEIAHKGGEAVRRTIAGMNTIRETIQDTSKRIKRLGESSQEIGNIVELIEEIAEQTNILALNASIEASRAGEASRGFAVVADEVQKLAERSTAATKKIEVLVSTIQSDTNEAVMSMERSTTDVVGGALLAENAGASLDEIEQVSHQIASLVHNISGSAKEQTSVASAITKNMHVLREISSKTNESTAATSTAISKLSELASQLRRSVAGFRLPDQSGGTGVLSPEHVAASLERGGKATPP